MEKILGDTEGKYILSHFLEKLLITKAIYQLNE